MADTDTVGQVDPGAAPARTPTGDTRISDVMNAEPPAEGEAAGAAQTPDEAAAAPGETGAFDAERFATDNEVDPSLVKGAKTVAEAIGRIAKRLRERERLGGRHEGELGELRARLKALEGAKPAAAKPPDQVDQFIAWMQADPAGAETWYQDQQDKTPMRAQMFLQEVQFRTKLKPLQEMQKATQEKVDQALSLAESGPLNQEFDNFAAAHPELDLAEGTDDVEALRAVGADLGVDLNKSAKYALEDVQQLAGLRKTGEAEYDRIVGLMRRGVKFADAKKKADEEAAARAAVATDRQVGRAAQVAGAGGTAGVAPSTGGHLSSFRIGDVMRDHAP